MRDYDDDDVVVGDAMRYGVTGMLMLMLWRILGAWGLVMCFMFFHDREDRGSGEVEMRVGV